MRQMDKNEVVLSSTLAENAASEQMLSCPLTKNDTTGQIRDLKSLIFGHTLNYLGKYAKNIKKFTEFWNY